MLRLAASKEGAPKQNLKSCPCQQKRAARLPSAAPGSIKEGGAPKRSRNEPRGSQVLRLAASRGGPRNALGYRPEPEVLPLPAETSREAAKCCAWQHQERGPRNALGRRPEPPASRNEPRGSQVLRLAASRLGPETRSGTVQSLKCVSVSQRGCV